MELAQSTSRVVVHFDVDAFYAQVEEVRDPSLKDRPLGITQKYLIVTSNYPARQRGVGKLMGIQEAKALCPDMVLINGEDLTPYRRASKRLLAVLQRFGEAERLGMDEVLVDVTEEAKARIAKGIAPPVWQGHVHTSQMGVVQENRHRVMDLRACAAPKAESQVPADTSADAPAAGWQLMLMVGSQVAAEARSAIKAEAGFRSSAGIACNRMLAKLSSGLHKPDDQTVLPPTEAATFVAPLPLRALPGVGFKLGAELKDLGLSQVQDIVPWSRASLVQKFGERIGSFLHQACRGEDPTPVKAKKPTKAITVEDSFKSCTSVPALKHILQILAPDLLARLHEEFQIHRPPDGAQAEALVAAALALFSRNVSPPFSLSLVNLGGTNFAESAPASGGIQAAFGRAPQKAPISVPAATMTTGEGRRAGDAAASLRRDYGAAPSGVPISKTEERRLREQANNAQAAQAELHCRGSDASSSDAGDVELEGEEEVPSLRHTISDNKHSTQGNQPILVQHSLKLQPRRQGLGERAAGSSAVIQNQGFHGPMLESFFRDIPCPGGASGLPAEESPPAEDAQILNPKDVPGSGARRTGEPGQIERAPRSYSMPASLPTPCPGTTSAVPPSAAPSGVAGIDFSSRQIAANSLMSSLQAPAAARWQEGQADITGPLQPIACEPILAGQERQAGLTAISDPAQEELRQVRLILGKRRGQEGSEEASGTEQERADAEFARRLQEEELGFRPKAQKLSGAKQPKKGTLQAFFQRHKTV